MKSNDCYPVSEREALLVLNAVGHLGQQRVSRLTEHFGSAANALQAAEKELAASQILSSEIVSRLVNFSRDEFLKTERELLKKFQVIVLTLADDDYPKLLKEIPDAPVVLYARGDIDVLNSPCIAVVGPRLASLYGLSVAEKFSSQLAESGITIVSGLAKGVDTSAHRGALKAKGKTIAVLGCGLAEMYPAENEKLSREIVRNGAVVSEFPMTMPPIKYNFPQRNRIISGLSLGVIIAEASHKSGALITSRFALEQGREVFAVPGKVDNPNAAGVNNLIKQGAKLIMSVEDVLEELIVQLKPYTLNPVPAETQTPAAVKNLTEEEREVSLCLGKQPSHIDQIAHHCGRSMDWLGSKLLSLELKGIVKQLPGKFFILTTNV